jgi:hypothetical protein
MFQEIFSNGLIRVPTVFYPVIFNALWSMLTGQHFFTKEHGKARYFVEQAFRTQRAIDMTGNALAQTNWIRFFAPYYSGFTDFIESAHNMNKFVEVIPCFATLEE